MDFKYRSAASSPCFPTEEFFAMPEFEKGCHRAVKVYGCPAFLLDKVDGL
jgi:hypothetical protein